MLLLLPLPSLLLRLQPQLLYTGPARLCATGPRMHRVRAVALRPMIMKPAAASCIATPPSPAPAASAPRGGVPAHPRTGAHPTTRR